MTRDAAPESRGRVGLLRKPVSLHRLRNRTLPLLVALILLLVTSPAFDTPGEATPIIEMLLFSAVPLFGVALLAPRRWSVVVAILALAIYGTLLFFHGPSVEGAIASWPGVLVLIFYIVATLTIAHAVFVAPSVLDDRVYGGIAVYLLIGITFAILHHMIGVQDPQAYTVSETAGVRVRLNWADYLYFSFVSLTTLGFGDIVPHNAWARNLSVTEGAVGMLYPAVLLARLVNRPMVAKIVP